MTKNKKGVYTLILFQTLVVAKFAIFEFYLMVKEQWTSLVIGMALEVGLMCLITFVGYDLIKESWE